MANQNIVDMNRARKLATMAEKLYGNKADARKAALEIMEREMDPDAEREQFIQDHLDDGGTRWEAMELWNMYGAVHK